MNYKFLEEDIFIKNDEIFELAKKLSERAFPNLVYGKNDKRWLYFYFPFKNALIPFALIQQYDKYYVAFLNGANITITKGNEKYNKIYKKIIEETLNFLPKIKENPKVIEEKVPIKYRTGKIKLKHTNLYEKSFYISKSYAREIKEKYLNHLKRIKPTYEVNADEYLSITNLALKALFPKEKEPYKKYCDRRSELLYSNNKNLSEINPHSFEILAGYSKTGICLIPPFNGFYYLFSSKIYYKELLKIVEKFLENNIPFKFNYKKVLNWLTGEAYIPVNKDDGIKVTSKKQKEFKYVKWEKLKCPKLKI
ncbi:MAG: hypothetical protein QXG91_02990 [Candidatus Aenigmatarchaeota archaeon]